MIILGIGSNLKSKFGNRFKNIKLAILFLKQNGINIIKKSSFYETPAYPDKRDPKFINIVISVKTKLSLSKLFSVIILIEKKLERKRGKKNSPRTCDIDIIDYNKKVFKFSYKKNILFLPHKNLSLRNFVLIPLREISPNWKHPKTKEVISTLINRLPIEDKKSILKINKN